MSDLIHLFNPVSSNRKYSRCGKLTGSPCHMLNDRTPHLGNDFGVYGYVGVMWGKGRTFCCVLHCISWEYLTTLNTSMGQVSKGWGLVKTSMERQFCRRLWLAAR